MKILILLFYKIKILNKNKNPSRLLAVIWLLLRTHSICGCLWCSRIWFVTGRGFWVAAGTGRSQWDRVQGPKLVAPCPLPRVKLNHSSHICVWPQQQLTPNKDVCPRASVPSFCCGFVTYLWWIIDWLPTWLRTVSTQLIWQRPKAPRQMKMTSQESGQRLNLFGGKVQLLRTHCPHLKISKNVYEAAFGKHLEWGLEARRINQVSRGLDFQPHVDPQGEGRGWRLRSSTGGISLALGWSLRHSSAGGVQTCRLVTGGGTGEEMPPPHPRGLHPSVHQCPSWCPA